MQDLRKGLFHRKIRYLLARASQKSWDALGDSIRYWKYNSISEKPIINSKEIRVLGLRRSGNHAIINWIRKQGSENQVFMNHVRVAENPYLNVYRDQCFLRQHPGLKDLRYEDLTWWYEQSRGRLSPKDLLIYSYEDQEIERVVSSYFEKRHDLYLGQSLERYDVLIIRDPFNLFASRIKGNRPRENARTFDFMKVYSKKHDLPQMWIDYAKECLNETNRLKHNKTVIKYNQWFQDVTYRQAIAERLGIPFSDKGFDEVVPAAGIGSSFDDLASVDKAGAMKVTERWIEFIDDPYFRQLVSNPELIEYSKKIFGTIPGTEVFES